MRIGQNELKDFKVRAPVQSSRAQRYATESKHAILLKVV
jgi:hypothetical protein